MALQVKNHPYKGRCYSVKEDVSRGTCLLVASPVALIPDSGSKRRICGHCMSWGDSTKDSPSTAGHLFLHHTCFSTYSNVDAIPGSRSTSLNELFFNGMPLDSCRSIPLSPSTAETPTELPRKCRVGPPCNQVFYCSVTCAEADWNAFHAIECSFLRSFFIGIPAPLPVASPNQQLRNKDSFDNYTLDFLWVLMRILTRRARELSKAAPETFGPSTTDPALFFDRIWALCDNQSAFPADSIALFRRIATRLLEFVQDHLLVAFSDVSLGSLLPPVSQADTPKERLFDSLVSLICKEECNSFGLYTFKYEGPQVGRQGFALGLYPSAVFFNHGCVPNVGHVTRSSSQGKDLIFYALSDLKKGDEALISYLEVETNESSNDTFTSSSQRRARLKEHFFFDCDCNRCVAELQGDENKAEALKKDVCQQLCRLNGCKGRFVPTFPGVFDVPAQLKSDRKDSGKDIPSVEGTSGLLMAPGWRCEACERHRE